VNLDKVEENGVVYFPLGVSGRPGNSGEARERVGTAEVSVRVGIGALSVTTVSEKVGFPLGEKAK